MFAKSIIGETKSIGAARQWKTKLRDFNFGYVMLEDYKSKAGHASVVIDWYGDKIQVLEANYVRCTVTTRWEKISPKMRFYEPHDPISAYFNAMGYIKAHNIKY